MAKYDPQKHHRRSIRLKGYDYSSPGAYFVTICTKERECVLDDPVVTGIITDVWHALPGWFPTIGLDEFVVMPNHVHFIVWIHPPDDVGAALAVAQDRAGADRAGASPAPTDTETGGDGVGATLAVAQDTDTEIGDDGVGATLAVAQDTDTEIGGDGVGATLAVAQEGAGWAGTSLAPTGGETRGVGVGATLAVAQNAVAQDMVAAQRAGASPAPTDTEIGGDGVGATLAVAQDRAGTRDAGMNRARAGARGVGVNMAGASPAPTRGGGAQYTLWTIPEPEKVNLSPMLGDVVGAFQSLVFTVYLDWIEANDPTRRAKFWQRNYYEHVIRNERELLAIRRYIRLNPDNWALDRDNPDNIRHLPPPETVEDYVREALAGGKNGVG